MELKSRILIVDDNEMLCASIKDIMEGRNYIVDSAYNGKEAIAICQKKVTT